MVCWMPFSASDKRVLVSRAEGLEQGGALDHLCNGLLSRWGHARSGALQTREGFVWILPVYTEIGQAFIWTEKGEIPWERLAGWLPADAELFVLGPVSDAELKAGRRSFPGLAPWKDGAAS